MIEAMKQALEALEIWEQMYPMSSASAYRLPAITSLRQAIAEAESKRVALDAIIKSSEKRNEEWDALSADEQAAYHAQNACPHCGGSGHKDDIAEAEKQEPVAMRYDFDGYGYKYIDSGSGSDWRTRIKDAEPVYTHLPKVEQEPVAWRWIPSEVWGTYVLSDELEKAELAKEHGIKVEPLYTHPQPKEKP